MSNFKEPFGGKKSSSWQILISKNQNAKSPHNIVEKVWSLAWELTYLDSGDSGWIYHSSLQQSGAAAEAILDQALKEKEVSDSTQEKLKTKRVSVFSESEFNEIVEVFRLLQRWRDEAKICTQNIESED